VNPSSAHSMEGAKIWIFFSQYWSGKNPKRLPSLLEKVSASNSWAENDIRHFDLPPKALERHKPPSVEQWSKLYFWKNLFGILELLRTQMRNGDSSFLNDSIVYRNSTQRENWNWKRSFEKINQKTKWLQNIN
jgi:hypothetical protein